MTIEAATLPDAKVTCPSCQACCCRLEVMLITDTSWCSALDRNSMLCTIYARRPGICRDFHMGGDECISERAANL